MSAHPPVQYATASSISSRKPHRLRLTHSVRLTSCASIKRITGSINALCVDRVSVGQGTGSGENLSYRRDPLRYEERESEVAEERYKLKTRLCQRSDYNPPGVGGTTQMYVLHHADQPLYHKLPKGPEIDTSISLWKGALKPLAAAALSPPSPADFTTTSVSPNKEVDDDEEEHTNRK